ncbi:MAG: hypothetical protein ACTS4T_00950 [Candidatus Hodgkinia cicadicola]
MRTEDSIFHLKGTSVAEVKLIIEKVDQNKRENRFNRKGLSVQTLIEQIRTEGKTIRRKWINVRKIETKDWLPFGGTNAEVVLFERLR